MFEIYPPEADKASFSPAETTEKLLALKKRGEAQERKEQIYLLQCMDSREQLRVSVNPTFRGNDKFC